MNSSVYPNPSRDGVVNLKMENINSFQVCNILGGVVYEFQNIAGVSGTNTFQLNDRGIYFVKMTSNTGINHSTILIFQ